MLRFHLEKFTVEKPVVSFRMIDRTVLSLYTIVELLLKSDYNLLLLDNYTEGEHFLILQIREPLVMLINFIQARGVTSSRRMIG